MMPDLGEYAVEVATAYAGSLLLLACLVALVVWRGGRVKRALARIEGRDNV